MIEIEKKFILTQEDTERLTNGADFEGESALEDTYYDGPDHSLTTKDWWLRKRNGRFELKLPLAGEKGIRGRTKKFREIEHEMEIREHFAFSSEGSFEEILKQEHILPFVKIRTMRRTCKKEGFVIVLDEMDYGYANAEIELLVRETKDVSEAEKRILSFAEAHGLALGPINGKVFEYLHRNDPRHFQALVDAGVA